METLKQLATKGVHPSQQREFIEAHSKQMLELAAKGVLGKTWTVDVDKAIMSMIKDGVSNKKMHRNWAMA
jgi:hypothetical protein